MHYSYTSTHCEPLPYVPMDTSGLSSILNQTCLPLGKEKEKLNSHNTNVDVQLFRIISLTFTGYNFHLQKVSLQERLTMSMRKTVFSSYLPKCHWYPILTMLSVRCSSKLLGSKALLLGGGGPTF